MDKGRVIAELKILVTFPLFSKIVGKKMCQCIAPGHFEGKDSTANIDKLILKILIKTSC